MVRNAGLIGGLALFVLMLALPAPAGLSAEGWRVAAVAVLMAAWWLSEAVPLTVTAFLPFLLLPALGVAEADDVAATYYSPILFLVLGGSIVACAVEKAGLHRRVALGIARRGAASPRGLVLAFAASTAVVSMGISNTATALIMTPVALALVAATEGRGGPGFAPALILAVAYGASIGGLGTIVGSPTNAISAALIERTLGVEISFLKWMAFGMPLVLLGVPVAAFLLNNLLKVERTSLDRAAVLASIGAAGPFNPLERRLLPIVLALIAGWTLLPPFKEALGLAPFDDGMVAIMAALVLFVVPSGLGDGKPILTWADTRGVPWDMIMMFGGGLALAAAITETGLSGWIGGRLEAVTHLPVWMVALLIVALVILITEFASNVATASGFMPVIAGLVLATGIDPQLLAIPAAMAASWGFMMPAGTGPNAIAYATGRVEVGQMVRGGFLLDLAGIPLIVGVCFAVAALI